ncbi:MAG: hypothetical protein HUJ68_09940 [Clostridia bacterium]|nr:hypothetical protein [Clostridia bacterium]
MNSADEWQGFDREKLLKEQELEIVIPHIELNDLRKPINYIDFYKNIPFQIRANPILGFYCGYVFLPKSWKFYTTYKDKDYDTFPLSPHGGITFSYDREAGMIIGFDCGHGDDSGCLALLSPENRNLYMSTSFDKDKFKDIRFVENECKDLIDQLYDVERQL